jgi:hypothetical protein
MQIVSDGWLSWRAGTGRRQGSGVLIYRIQPLLGIGDQIWVVILVSLVERQV